MSNQTKVHTKMRCINQAAGDDLITKQPSPVHPNDHHFWWNLWNFGVPSTTGLTTVYLRSLTHVNRIQDAFCSPDIEDSARAALPSCCTLCGRLSGLEGLFFVGCNPSYTYLLLVETVLLVGSHTMIPGSIDENPRCLVDTHPKIQASFGPTLMFIA